MSIVIRADASVHIGSGHVMRCLTLADELNKHGALITFVCRDWDGNLEEYILSKGYHCLLLPKPSSILNFDTDDKYAPWLGVSREQDAEETLETLTKRGITKIDWCITDHYAIDARWHRRIRSKARQIMVIDDIANREHDCDVLLDQNLYDSPEKRYISLVPSHCRLLLGPKYALLRPEFREARERLGENLIRSGEVRRIVVFFGGSDPSNETAKAVKALQMLGRGDIEADIIIGIANPHRSEIEQLCALSPNLHFHCQVPNMADFMIKADLAIGAGGSTTWERCCLGLPTLAIIIAENQVEMTETAARHGLQWNLGWYMNVTVEEMLRKILLLLHQKHQIRESSKLMINFVDGLGVQKVIGETPNNGAVRIFYWT